MHLIVVAGVVGCLAAASDDLHSGENLMMDDACADGADSEECGLSLRQLRGKTSFQAVGEHARDADDAGFCCYSWSDDSNVGGSCYPTAKAKAGEYCAKRSTCGGCGGKWVKMQCVFSGSDPSDICGSAYDTAVATDEDYCAQSSDVCEGTGCKGHWCVAPLSVATSKDETQPAAAAASEEPAAADVPPEEDQPEKPTAGQDSSDGMPSTAAAAEAAPASLLVLEAVAVNETGYCCYAATKGTCGSCYPTARAKAGDYCATSKTCGGCGGTWCQMHCVYSGANPLDVCGSAYSTAIAKEDECCAQSGDVCEGSKCKGNWCSASNAVVKTKKQDEEKHGSDSRRRRRRRNRRHGKGGHPTTTVQAAAPAEEPAPTSAAAPEEPAEAASAPVEAPEAGAAADEPVAAADAPAAASSTA